MNQVQRVFTLLSASSLRFASRSERNLALHFPATQRERETLTMDFPDFSSFLKDLTKGTKILEAACSGNLRALKKNAKKLDNGEGIATILKELKYPEGHGVLSLAASKGRTEICQYLIEELGFPVDYTVDDGDTALIATAKEGQAATARYLMDRGADPTAADKDCYSALHLAAEFGHNEVVELLLSRGVPVDLEINLASGTPLLSAARSGHESTIKILVEHNADVNKILNGVAVVTPLNLCITAGCLKCVKLLIEAGADPNLKCPLGRAISEEDIHTVKFLLEAGANPNIPDDFGRLPIETAAMGNRKEIVEMLFPHTTPIPNLRNWSVTGIIRHANTNSFKKKVETMLQNNLAELKEKGDGAFRKKDYHAAIFFYSCVITVEPTNATLCSNRSLCFLRIGDGKGALQDAKRARQLRPSWPKVHYRVGSSFMLLKEYGQACRAFMNALELEPTNEEIQKAFCYDLITYNIQMWKQLGTTVV